MFSLSANCNTGRDNKRHLTFNYVEPSSVRLLPLHEELIEVFEVRIG
jgi:hypothetical protein